MDKVNFPHEQWLNQARSDLFWTQANLREEVWYGVCFTAQQAAEKALKAYLIFHQKNIMKIHDLGAILEECISIDHGFENLRQECVTLTDYYVPTRYPDIIQFTEFNEAKAREAYMLAERIVEFVEGRLPPCG